MKYILALVLAALTVTGAQAKDVVFTDVMWTDGQSGGYDNTNSLTDLGGNGNSFFNREDEYVGPKEGAPNLFEDKQRDEIKIFSDGTASVHTTVLRTIYEMSWNCSLACILPQWNVIEKIHVFDHTTEFPELTDIFYSHFGITEGTF